MFKKKGLIVLFSISIILVSCMQAASAEVSESDLSNIPSSNSQTKNLAAQKSFHDFLVQVAGLSLEDYNVTNFRVSNSKILGSEKNQTSISSILVGNQGNLSVSMILSEGKVRFYDLQLLSGTLSGSELSVENCLANTKRSIVNYQTVFNADYCSGFASIMPISLNSQYSSFNDDKVTLNVQVNTQIDQKADFLNVAWFKTIDNVVIQQLSVQATVSKNGILTSFSDNLGLYEVATTNVFVKEDEALKIAMPYIEKFATDNDLKIESTNATLSFVRDIEGSRGDSSLIYPQWQVSAIFDKWVGDIVGFNVHIWADNSVVSSAIPQGVYLSSPDSPDNSIYVMIVVILGMSAAILTLYTAKKRKGFLKKNLHQFCAFITLMLLFSTFLIPSVAALPSSILSCTTHINTQEELDKIEDLASDISDWSDSAGYTPYNSYGDNVTSSALYAAAYDQGEDGSIVFYDGHGGFRTVSYWFEGLLYFANQVIMCNNSYEPVWDYQIYANSYSQSSGHKQVGVFWACNLADLGVGDYRFIPGHPEMMMYGMPLAWTHSNSLSTDGFNYPDNSGQAFVGWKNICPYLTYTIDSAANAGYLFMDNFYQATLLYGYPINSALEYSAKEVWSKTFEQSMFGAGGFQVYNMDTHLWEDCGPLVVYGQGTLYMGDALYVDDEVYEDYGYSCGYVDNEEGFVGPQNDGDYTQLYAGDFGDFAWVTGHMNNEIEEDQNIHLWGYIEPGCQNHVRIYVSETYYGWSCIFDDYVDNYAYNYDPVDFDFGSSVNSWRYIAITVYNDIGSYSPNSFYIDSVHVY